MEWNNEWMNAAAQSTWAELTNWRKKDCRMANEAWINNNYLIAAAIINSGN